MYKGCIGIKAETRVYLERPLKLYLEWTGFAPHPPRAGVGVQGGKRGGLSALPSHLSKRPTGQKEWYV